MSEQPEVVQISTQSSNPPSPVVGPQLAVVPQSSPPPAGAKMTASINLTPAKVDVSGIRAGDKNEITATLRDSSGTPIDLTEYEVRSMVRKNPLDELPAIIAVIQKLDETQGYIMIKWPGDQVSNAMSIEGTTTFKGVWDLQIERMGEVTTICEGTFQAVMDITR